MTALLDRAREIRLLVLDVDGVFTDGRLWYGAQGEMMKAMDVRDGHGLVMLRHAGIQLAVLSGRPQMLLRRRFEELGFGHIEERCRAKAPAIAAMATDLGVSLEQTAFMGDDVNDIPALETVGLSACPADAAPEVHRVVDHVCARPGGRGAVREVCELILGARGEWPPR